MAASRTACYKPDALPVALPTVSKHWKAYKYGHTNNKMTNEHSTHLHLITAKV